MKQLSEREKRLLMLLGPVILVVGFWQVGLWSSQSGTTPSGGSIEAMEQRFQLARDQAAQKPLSDAEYQTVEQALEKLETRLLASETSALAQAEVRSLLGDLLKAEGIVMRSSRFGTVVLEGEHYSQVPLTVDFTCAIEQFVNLSAALASAPKLLTTRSIRVNQDNADTKAVRVQMTVAGYLPIERTPELARIAHHVTAKARDRPVIASLRLCTVLSVLSSTLPRADRRAPRTDGPLTHFRSPRGEQCGLGPYRIEACWRSQSLGDLAPENEFES